MGISQEQALDCFASDDLIGIGMEADAIRREMHPEGVVSYAVERNVAFEQNVELVEDGAGIFARIRDAVRDGASTIRLVPRRRSVSLNGSSTATAFEQLTTTLTAVRELFPETGLQASSTSGILRFAAEAGLDVPEVLLRLRDAGLDSIAGDQAAETPETTTQWIAVHRSAHEAGLGSTASMILGAGESTEDRVARLFAIRSLQEQTHGFLSFALLTAGSGLEAPTAVEYLRTLAISRIVLDNVEHVESSCVAQGIKLAQMALRFGANDLGAIQADDDTVQRSFTEEDVRRVIRDGGYMPVERDLTYRTMALAN